MLAFIGLLVILTLLVTIMTNKLSPLVALIAIPVVGALAAGFHAELGGFMVNGVKNIAPVVGMFVFAILFFGVLTDAGTMDPIINRIVRIVGTDPVRISLGTAALAAIVHLDGSGAVTFMITVSALLPLYERLQIDRRVLACVTAMAAGVGNMLPWGGPVLRAASALEVPVMDLYLPLLPVQLVGFGTVFLFAWILGRKVRRDQAAGVVVPTALPVSDGETVTVKDDPSIKRPRMFGINVLLVLLVLGAMISGKLPPVVCFMLGTIIALTINYPRVAEQRARINAHAQSALLMGSILFAAGVFTGILNGTGMLKAMAGFAASHVPGEAASHIPFALGLLSMPLSMLFDPDSFYFGILPVLAQVLEANGIAGMQAAHAVSLGQMTTGFPVSPLTPATFLLIGLCKLDLGTHQRFTIPWLFAISVVMTFAAVAIGLFPL